MQATLCPRDLPVRAFDMSHPDFDSQFCRGRKIGDRLMDAVEVWARAEGSRAVYLDCHTKRIAANRLYRSRGYEEIARYNENWKVSPEKTCRTF